MSSRLLGLAASLALAAGASAAHAGICHEASDVVGYKRCGDWDLRWAASRWDLQIDLGYVHTIGGYDGVHRTLAFSKPIGETSAAGNGFDLHLRFGDGRAWYVPVRLDAAFAQSVALESGIGIRIPIGPVLVRPELETGLRWAMCRDGSKCSIGSLALEPLLAVDVWTTTFTTLGVFVGTEPFGLTKLEVGIRVGASSQPEPGRF